MNWHLISPGYYYQHGYHQNEYHITAAVIRACNVTQTGATMIEKNQQPVSHIVHCVCIIQAAIVWRHVW